MKLLIIDNDYPNEHNLYGDVFVHVRVKEYQQLHECVAISLAAKNNFIYEGVTVKAFADIASANAFITGYQPDIILIHFVLKQFIEEIIPRHQCPYVVWVHGYEALSWRRRMFNYTWRNFIPQTFLLMVRSSRAQLKSVGSLIRQSNNGLPVHFVFVSNWMKRICEKDTAAKVNNYSIIPNPIDTALFQYRNKEAESRKHILLIRPFSTKKYATDIASEAIQILSGKAFFSDLKITIIGSGRYYEQHTAPLRSFANVTLINRFLTQSEMKEYHDRNGIFLCPTRQDAQGVSMCEAMSSGLVPITSNNTAIPEYVEHEVSGFLTKNAAQIAQSIEYLYHHPEKFTAMSAAAAERIKTTCSIQYITGVETKLLGEMLQRS